MKIEPRHKLPLAFALWSGFIVSLVVATVLVFSFGGMFTAWMRSVSTVSNLHFFMGNGASRALYSVGILDISKVPLPAIPGDLIDYVTQGGVAAGVLITDTQGTKNELVLLGENPTVLTSDGSIKFDPSISPDGTKIAYASFVPPQGVPVAESLASSTPDMWEVRVISIETKEITVLGKGSAPQYFTRDGKTFLLITTNEGFTVLNEDGTVHHSHNLSGQKQNIVAPIIVSQNGKYLTVTDTTRLRTEVFSIEFTTDGSITLFSEGVLPPRAYGMTFVENILYAFVRSGSETYLVATSPDTAAKAYPIRTFSNDAPPYRLGT